jgi:hypothetical protein
MAKERSLPRTRPWSWAAWDGGRSWVPPEKWLGRREMRCFSGETPDKCLRELDTWGLAKLKSATIRVVRHKLFTGK